MLISVVVDPVCLSPQELGTPEASSGAECILEAATENAVIIAPAIDQFVGELIDDVARLDSGTGQLIQLGAAELAKSPARIVIAPPAELFRASGQQGELRELARIMRADALVLRRDLDLADHADLVRLGIEVCHIDQYRLSQTERRRRLWRSGQRLDTLPAAEAKELLGRVIKYAAEVVLLDKMFARAGKDGTPNGRLRRFVRGVVHIANQWRAFSPYAQRVAPAFTIVSSAGSCGASAGFVDPARAEAAIRAAIAQEDRSHLVRNLSIELRQDDDPGVFNDRFVPACGRCFSIGHGLDDIGNLIDPKAKKRPTTLAPDCQAYRDICADIRVLPKA
ncbi:MAG: hypothetical protein IPM64_12510 [Phycisphaerales bacterium]|nr:hypothetical protein [Phycisphaerales bacterium]